MGISYSGKYGRKSNILYRLFIFRSEMSLSSGGSRRVFQTLENTCFFLKNILNYHVKLKAYNEK